MVNDSKINRVSALAPEFDDAFQLSRRVQQIPQAFSIYMNQLVSDRRAKGEDLIVLSAGEAYLQRPAHDFSDLDTSKVDHYSDSRGLLALRRRIAAHCQSQCGAIVDPETELVITAGSKIALYMTLQAILNSDDEVLIHEPAWLSYQEHVRLLDAEPVFAPCTAALVDLPQFMSPKTRAVIINNPNNPAGRNYGRSELEALYRVCRARGVYIISDEAYSDFVIDETFCSFASIAQDKLGVVVVNSLSKNLGLSGWRIGYVIASQEFTDAFLKLNQHLITCAPSILMHYLERNFDALVANAAPQIRDLMHKRQRIAAHLKTLGLEALSGASTFYFLISIGAFPGSSIDFALHLLLQHRIAVVPGSAYGKTTDRFVRISIGTETEARIQEALRTIATLSQANQFDRDTHIQDLVAAGVDLALAGGDR